MRIFHRNGRTPTVKLEEAESTNQPNSLKNLCEGDERLYDAMENYLLLDPARQIPSLGEPGFLFEKGNAARTAGNKIAARVEYETAVRVEIARNSKESASKFLLLADEVSDQDIEFQRHHVLLDNIDRVMQIANAYYGRDGGQEKPNAATQDDRDLLLTVQH